MKPIRYLMLLALSGVLCAHAETFILPPPDVDLVGDIRIVYAEYEDTLLDIARRYSLGYEEIIHANPGVDRWIPEAKTPIVLPTRYILPDAPREGIVINLSELRLYYYPKAGADEKPVVITHPISVGRMDWKTPQGKTTIVRKQTDPSWYPPESIKAEHAAQGDILPDVVPGGPDNPLGRHAMYLGISGYLIHGTNRPYGIGMRVTHGCIRMYPEDIERIFPRVPIGTPVRIVDQPVKVGRLAGALFLESHAPLEEFNLPIEVTFEQAIATIKERLGPDMPGVDPEAVKLAVDQLSGMPVPIMQREQQGEEPLSAQPDRLSGMTTPANFTKNPHGRQRP